MKYDKIYKIGDLPVYMGAFETYKFVDRLPQGSIFIYFPSWCVSKRNILKYIRYDQNSRLCNIDFIYGAATKDETNLLRLFGKSAFMLNHNMNIDENKFYIEESSKSYDFLLVSQLEKFKRIHLGELLNNVALVKYGDMNGVVGLNISNYLPGLKYLNDHHLNSAEMRGIYNRSKVYGIFSKREGPNLATVEALLCGLPIISTSSVGGREIFLNNENSKIVKDCPQAIMAAGQVMLENYKMYNPHNIRNDVIEKIQNFRNNLIDIVCIRSNLSREMISDVFSEFYSRGIDDGAIHLHD